MKKTKFIPEFDDIPTPRVKMPELELEERRGNFDEVELGFTQELAAAEAMRCLSCRKCVGCGLCLAECDKQAIVYDMEASVLEFSVESVVLAVGSECFDATRKPELGYATSPNVVTTPELERMLSPTGPYRGVPLRPGDGALPGSVAFVQCVGSREEAIGASFCSTSCCTDALKLVDRLLGTGRTSRATVFHRGMRPLGRVGERLYQQAKADDAVEFVFAEVERIDAGGCTGSVTVSYDAGAGSESAEFDLVVLSVGRQASRAARSAARLCRAGTNKFGFLQTGATSAATPDAEGVTVAGACSGPTGLAGAMISSGAASTLRDGVAPNPRFSEAPGATGGAAPATDGDAVVWLCGYGLGIDGLDASKIAERVSKLPGIASASSSRLACAPSSVADLGRLCEEQPAARVLVVGCRPGSHERFWRERCAGMASVSSVALVPLGRDAAGKPSPEESVAGWLAGRQGVEAPVDRAPRAPDALVVGGSVAGVAAADELSRHGTRVTLIARGESLAAPPREREFLDDPAEEVDALVERVSSSELVDVRLGSSVDGIEPVDGGFDARLGLDSATFGAVILAGETVDYEPGEYPADDRVITQTEFAARFRGDLPEPARVVMIQCVGSRSEERPYCSRTCCAQAMKNALRLKQKYPDAAVTVLHRTIRVWGFDEEMFSDALDLGVEFVRVAGVPEVSAEGEGALGVSFVDSEGGEACLEADLVVLSNGVVPSKSTAETARVIGLELDGVGFLVPIDETLAPVETCRAGVFAAGPAVEPMNLREAALGGRAAAGKANLFLRRDT